MKGFFLILILFAKCCSYEIIPSVFHYKPLVFYLDSTLSPMHIQAFNEAVNTWRIGGYCNVYSGGVIQGLTAKFDYINTVTYSNKTEMASSILFAGYNHASRRWILRDADIIINKNNLIDYNASVNALLHELGHNQFLEHDLIPGSVMNNSVVVGSRNQSVPTNKWTLHPDNKYAAYLTYTQSQYYQTIIEDNL